MENGQDVLKKAAFTIAMQPTAFKTGSKGYRGQGKVVAEDGRRYQVMVQAVEIHSKVQ